MPIFNAWDIVKVPFPYTDQPVRERRPALVVAAGSLQDQHGLLWVMMITSSGNRGWLGDVDVDVDVSDLSISSLPVASVVRTAKITTIEAREAKAIGVLPRRDRSVVSRHLLANVAGLAASGATATAQVPAQQGSRN
jgi:mRNA interferase MazF